MHLVVLGSAAGGGFPQWNCRCPNCERARRGELAPRTQSSLAVSAGGERWVLINASPDVRQQMEAFAPLRGGGGRRGSALAGVVLTDSQVDHATGLILLREGGTLELHATEAVHRDLRADYPLLRMLEAYGGYRWHPVPADGETFAVAGAPGLEFSALRLAGKGPPYRTSGDPEEPGLSVALRIRDGRTGRTALYSPALPELDDRVREAARGSDLWLLDGTFWTDDEMIRRECGTKRARQMGHLPLSGPGGILERAEGILARKVLVHVNNTNPVLDGASPERAELRRRGFEVAEDGDLHRL